MGGEVNGKMLKKGSQETSTRLHNGVVVRERIEYKGHHPVQKSRAFGKARAVSELALTPLRRTLTKRGHELIFGYNPQTFTGRIVKKIYPRNPKHIRNKLDRKSVV